MYEEAIARCSVIGARLSRDAPDDVARRRVFAACAPLRAAILALTARTLGYAKLHVTHSKDETGPCKPASGHDEP